MFRTRYDLPLERDVTGRFLPWIVALMVYLAILALAGTLVLSDLASRWDRGLTGTLTVQIPPLAGAEPSSHGERVAKALDVLRAGPGIVRAEALPGSTIESLLEPWLGRNAAIRDLPLPALIDVSVSPGADMARLTERLRAAVPEAEVDDHATWLRDLLTVTRTIQTVALGMVAVVGAAAVAAVMFVARAGLAIHASVVELLHMIGASDRYVARQFQAHVLGMALRGSLAGLGLGLATLAAIHYAAATLQAGALLPDVTLSYPQLLALCAVPAAACLLAALTARITVLRSLARMP
jgi:cell division transport system permease protein